MGHISGNIYVTGLTNQGLSGQTQQGIIDYFLAKYDSSGNLLFTRQVGASGGTTSGYGVSTDISGNIYVTGLTNQRLSGQTQQGIIDYFLAKYDSSGNLIFTRQVGTPGGDAEGNGVSTDSSGNIYVTGLTNQGLSGQTRQGYYDYFLAKYDSSGNLLFTRQVGAPGGYTRSNGVSTDSSGNIYVTGLTNQGLSGQTQQGNDDYFLAKYDSSGNLLFTRQVGASGGSTFGRGVSTDSLGNAYVAGYTRYSSTGISGQTQQGNADYFLAKCNAKNFCAQANIKYSLIKNDITYLAILA